MAKKYGAIAFTAILKDGRLELLQEVVKALPSTYHLVNVDVTRAGQNAAILIEGMYGPVRSAWPSGIKRMLKQKTMKFGSSATVDVQCHAARYAESEQDLTCFMNAFLNA
jgi:hypothetical protein